MAAKVQSQHVQNSGGNSTVAPTPKARKVLSLQDGKTVSVSTVPEPSASPKHVEIDLGGGAPVKPPLFVRGTGFLNRCVHIAKIVAAFVLSAIAIIALLLWAFNVPANAIAVCVLAVVALVAAIIVLISIIKSGDQTQKLADEVDRMSDLNNKNEEAIGRLQAANNRYEELNQQLGEKIEAFQAENTRLHEEVGRLQEISNGLLTIKESFESLNQALNASKGAIHTEVGSLQTAVLDLQNKLPKSEGLTELSLLMQTVSTALGNLQSLLSEDKVKNIIQSTQSAQQALESLRLEIAKLEGVHETMQGSVQQLQKEIAALSKTRSELDTSTQHAKETMDRMQQQLERRSAHAEEEEAEAAALAYDGTDVHQSGTDVHQSGTDM